MSQKTDKKQCVGIVGISSICRAKDFNCLEFDINFSIKVLRREIQTYLQTLKTCQQPLSVCLFSGSSPTPSPDCLLCWKIFSNQNKAKKMLFCPSLQNFCQEFVWVVQIIPHFLKEPYGLIEMCMDGVILLLWLKQENP